MILNQQINEITSFVPDQRDMTGLTHLYRENGAWKFITEDEYESRKDELPDLCFAIRYPFENFE